MNKMSYYYDYFYEHPQGDPKVFSWRYPFSKIPLINKVHLVLWSHWQFAKQLANMLICWLTEHKFVDDSRVGPDSGDMAFHCTRCHWSFHHTLY